jgi:hypothetical protein
MVSILLLLIETVFMYLLYKKYGFKNAILLVYIIVFFYCNAIVIDFYFLLRIKELNDYVTISRDSIAMDLTVFSYFLFLGTYFIGFYYLKLKTPLKQTFNKSKSSNILIYTSIFVMLLIISINSKVTRLDLKESGNIFTTSINWFILFYWSYVVFCKKEISKKLLLFYSTVVIFYCVYTYEREPIVFFGVLLALRFSKKIKLIYVIPSGIISLYVLSYYKAFYLIILRGYDSKIFFKYVSNNPISLSKLDPTASFRLLYDFFDTKPLFYYDYNFTYFTSFIDQFNRYINGHTVFSMSKVASRYYVGDTYGLAFSMILESVINFWYFGPIILAIVARVIYKYLKTKFYYLNEVIDLIFIMFFLSFVRTELIVMSKVFIFPMILFLLIVHFNFKKTVHF